MNSRLTIQLIGGTGKATLIALTPFAIHVGPHLFGGGVFFSSMETLFLAFALAGVAAAHLLDARPYICVVGGILGYIVATRILEMQGFIGRGGDGDLFYLGAIAGVGIFCVSAVVSSIVIKRARQSRSSRTNDR